MAVKSFPVGKGVRILIQECAGDLVVRPWLAADVRASGKFDVQASGDELAFQASGDLALNVPAETPIVAKHVRGDASIRSLTASASVERVGGDVVVGNMAELQIGRVRGDLVATNLSGSISLEQVEGDALVRNLDGALTLSRAHGDMIVQYARGPVTLNQVLGDAGLRNVNGGVEITECRRDVNLRNIGGPIHVNNVAGDIRLQGGLGPQDHALNAGGDIVLIWPRAAPLLLEGEAALIDNRLKMQDVHEEEGRIQGRIGDGKTRLTVRAGGTLVLKEAQMISEKWRQGTEEMLNYDFMSELGDLGAKISSEIEQQVARVSAELENNFGSDFMRRMAEQFSGQVKGAAKKAGAKPETAPAGRAPKEQSGAAEMDGSQGAAAGTREAQLKILQMVEKGTISPEEASLLLEALGND